MTKKIVLTGAGGFLGCRLVPRLLEKDVALVAITSKKRSALEDLCGVGFSHQNIEIVNVLDTEAQRSAMYGADVLVNCAFPRHVDGGRLAEGLRFTAGLFEDAFAVGVKSVVNISSQSVYSQQRETLANERTQICLESKYAVAKYAVELMLESACSGIPYTNVRLASLIGVGFDQRVVNRFAVAAVSKREIKVEASSSRYGFFDVRDAAEALALLILSDSGEWSKCYNLGAEGSYTLLQIANQVAAVAKGRIGDVVVTQFTKGGETSINSSLDSGLFYRQFAWKPKINLARSIEDIFEGVVRGREIVG